MGEVPRQAVAVVASIPWTPGLLALPVHWFSAVPLSYEPMWADKALPAQRIQPVALLWAAKQIAKGFPSPRGGFSILLGRWRQLGM